MTGSEIRDLLKIEHYRTLKGLVQSFFQLIFLVSAVFFVIQQVTPIPNLTAYKFILVIFLLEVLNFFVWLGYRVSTGLIMSKKNKINIAFSIKVTGKSRELYEQLISNFRRQIQLFDKRDNFYIFELPNTFNITSHTQAERIIKNEHIQLLIWGDADEGKQSAIQTTEFNLAFTYNFNITSHTKGEFNQKHQLFLSNIQQSLVGRQWSILEPQSLPHIRVVNENLVETSLYILSRCLITFGYMGLGFEYLNALLTQLNALPDTTFPNFVNFKKMVRSTLLLASSSLTMYYLRVKKNYDLAESYARFSLKLQPSEYAPYTQLAVITCLKGNYSEAYRLMKTAKKLNPSNDINRINDAFFALHAGKYKKAIIMYHKIKFIPQGVDILPIIDMLEDQSEAIDKPAFLFGAGYMSYYFADKNRSRELLSRFLERAQPASDYQALVDVANTLLLDQ